MVCSTSFYIFVLIIILRLGIKTLNEITIEEGYSPEFALRVANNYIADFKKGVEFDRTEMRVYYLVKEFLFWYAENCSALKGNFWDAERFYRKRDKAHQMRHLIDFNIY